MSDACLDLPHVLFRSSYQHDSWMMCVRRRDKNRVAAARSRRGDNERTAEQLDLQIAAQEARICLLEELLFQSAVGTAPHVLFGLFHTWDTMLQCSCRLNRYIQLHRTLVQIISMREAGHGPGPTAAPPVQLAPMLTVRSLLPAAQAQRQAIRRRAVIARVLAGQTTPALAHPLQES